MFETLYFPTYEKHISVAFCIKQTWHLFKYSMLSVCDHQALFSFFLGFSGGMCADAVFYCFLALLLLCWCYRCCFCTFYSAFFWHIKCLWGPYKALYCTNFLFWFCWQLLFVKLKQTRSHTYRRVFFPVVIVQHFAHPRQDVQNKQVM